MLGRTSTELRLWQNPKGRERYLEMLNENNRIRNLEQVFFDNSGAARTLLLSAETMSIGGRECIVTVAMDITERKREEKQAERQREELIEAEKMISLGTLVSGVAHEVNNPNQLIILNAPILRDAWKDVQPLLDHHARGNSGFQLANMPYADMRTEIPELIDDILQGADRIRFIVSELRNYACKQSPHSMSRVSMNDVLKSALTLVAVPIRHATNRFSVDWAADLPDIRGNHRRLEQVVINLILNACQALPSSDKAVQVKTRHDPGTESIVLTVEDEGCGIAEKDLGHILHPFYTTKRDAGGTGLGLSVAARIVQQHKGSLEYASELGKGTTVQLSLPVDVECHAEEPSRRIGT